jgi:hypothetical protein
VSRTSKAIGGALALVLLLAACGGTAVGTSSAAAQATVNATLAPTERPTPTAPPALVGSWLGLHNCQRILDVLTAAGMPEQALANIVDSGVLPGVTTIADIADPNKPCVGAVDVPHSHFFTASGEFGSRDATGQRVDDGQWSMPDPTTFTINGVPFRFEVTGDELRMEAVDVGTCPSGTEWCEEAWKLMVAMPGMAWTREK